jgi:hypothetical protein
MEFYDESDEHWGLFRRAKFCGNLSIYRCTVEINLLQRRLFKFVSSTAYIKDGHNEAPACHRSGPRKFITKNHIQVSTCT